MIYVIILPARYADCVNTNSNVLNTKTYINVQAFFSLPKKFIVLPKNTKYLCKYAINKILLSRNHDSDDKHYTYQSCSYTTSII